MEKFNLQDFYKKYPNDKACLKALFEIRYGKNGRNAKCKKCKRKGTFSRVKGRKCYACICGGHQIYPTANTIFHKSSTSLKAWFYMAFLLCQDKSGIPAKGFERQLGITYKCAHRMGLKLREKMSQKPRLLKKLFSQKGIEGKEKFSTAKFVMDPKTEDPSKVISIAKARINIYKYLVAKKVMPGRLNSLYSKILRSINGSYHAVSPEHLQKYLDEFTFRYNHRKSKTHPFKLLIEKIAN